MADYDTNVEAAEDVCSEICELGVIIDAVDETEYGIDNHDKSQVMMGNENVLTTLHTCQRGDRPIKSDNNSCFTTVRAKSLDPFASTDGACTASQLTQRDKLVGVPSLVGSHSNTNTVILNCKSMNNHNGLQTDDIVPITSSTLQTGGSLIEPKPHSHKLRPAETPAIQTIVKTGYNKPSYPVLVGDTVRLYATKTFTALPHLSKYMVKERLPNSSKPRLVLKSSETERVDAISKSCINLLPADTGDSKTDTEEYTFGRPEHYRENCKTPGYFAFTCSKFFRGKMKYPIPSGRANDNKIGKGGNGFVFTMYHERRQYAVKKTVYRSNEVNVHSSLRHENIIPLVAVLMGERHERHVSKFYCFHFMPKMDCDLRQILSARDIGCLKHFYSNCAKDPRRWEVGFNNIKFILGKTLKALTYLHANGYVHRDIKASNIMIKMQCRCQPLSCRCSSKFQVKLGDFDSAGTVPGLGIKEPTDQMIKFASILPLGTPGYRAPEVSMHITLSGPYETLYTFAVDMWSFGCLCLNICIGKTAALRQREEACLLLSRTHQCSKELWEKTTKIKELECTKPFLNETHLINLVKGCLQVNSMDRPTSKDALKVFN
ncbi:uncharacterized protein [Dysidea avara]